jgi:hypothetical protein
MVVFCPGCGAKISVDPAPARPDVRFPRCQSAFSTAGLKPAADAPPPRRFRKKKNGGSGAGVGAFAVVLLLLAGGAWAVWYFADGFGRRTIRSGSTTDPGRPPAAPEWHEYVNADGKFRVLVPGTPTRDVWALPGRGKAGKKAVSFTADAPDAKYGVAYADFDQPGDVDKFVQRQPGELASRGGKLLGEKDVAAGPHKGKEFLVEVPGQGTAHIRFYVVGRRLYKVMAHGADRPPPPADVARFLDSFQITDG